MIDRELRKHIASMDVPLIEQPQFTAGLPLAHATVAIVTTAGLMHPGEPWNRGDGSYRSFSRDDRNLIVGHVSPNFDRVGVSADLNIAYPADRLDELAARGVIGEVASRHLSFMGGLADLDEVQHRSGPGAAEMLLADSVDVVLLCPMCPACPRTLALLAHVLERAGLVTVCLMSNETFAARMRPPRALVCDFPLGRPLGVPDDPEFQHGVIEQGLALVAEASGPVLSRHDVIIEDRAEESFEPPGSWSIDPTRDAVDEVLSLLPTWEAWWAGCDRSTQVGRNVEPPHIERTVHRLVRYAGGAPWDQLVESPGLIAHDAMDLRVFYEEAALSSSTGVPPARTTQTWFHRSTASGRLLEAVAQRLRTATDVPKTLHRSLEPTLPTRLAS